MSPNGPQAGFRPTGPDESRRVPPHGPVSPDGSRAWPQPSQTSRLIVYGGVALAVAGLTAGTVLLGRKLAGSDAPAPADPAPPRAAAMPEPVQPPPRRRRRRNPALRLADLTRAVQDASAFIGMAIAGFRAVAENAQGLGEQFRTVADAWREGAEPGTGSREDRRATPADDDRLHRL